MQALNKYTAGFSLKDDFFISNLHDVEPFFEGHLDVKLPAPNNNVRLFIFNPNDYPYLWLKYVEGLEREYTRIGANHILDLKALETPDCSPLAMLAMFRGEIISGIRFHGPLLKVKEATVLQEMMGGNCELLEKYIQQWLPENIIEPKGIWVNSKHPLRKQSIQLMARSGLYGALLMGCRYVVCSSPSNMKKIYLDIGMKSLPDIGTVAYPTENFKTSCGYVDLNLALNLSKDEAQRVLRREWAVIHQMQARSSAKKISKKLPVILDEENPFHSSAIESLLIEDDYNKISISKNMSAELNKILANDGKKTTEPRKRWVLYPWRKEAVELLAPIDFRKVRYDRNRNKITEQEQVVLSTLSIGVVGLSTGNIIAHTLAMEGLCGHLKLADFDELDVSNLNRIPASLLDVGKNKAIITAQRISEIDPYIKIEVFEEGLNKANIERFIDKLDIIIEECDSLDIKLLVREVALKHRVPVLMSTSDLGMVDVERFDLEDDLKPFHGLIDANANELRGLSRRDEARYGLSILEGEKVSARLVASMTEIGHTLNTWPQLASDVTQGAAMIATAVRRIGTGKALPSGRIRVDMDEVLENSSLPAQPYKIDGQPTEKPIFSGNPRSDMLLAANLAPSAGNIQPWKIYWKNEQLHFEIDRKLTSVRDVCWRASMVSIGAACLSAEIVAAHYGLPGEMVYSSKPDQSDLVARWIPGEEVNSSLVDLFPYLLTRMTNRNLGDYKELPGGAIDKLKEITKEHSVSMHVLTQRDELKDYAQIAAESDRLRHLCQHLHREVVEELVWPGVHSLEQGIDVRTLGMDKKDLNIISAIQREDVMNELAKWDTGYALGDYSRDRIAAASAMVVLGVDGQSELDYLNGGRALQHFWLLAEEQGLAVQPISPVFLYANSEDEVKHLMQEKYIREINELKIKFKNMFNMNQKDYPVLVLRLAYAKKQEYFSLRRGVI